MSEPPNKTLKPGDAHFNAGIDLGSSDGDPTRRDPIISNPSQILLEALQNFVVPLIHAVDISQVHLGLEAEKLLTALQEFISLMIMQLQVGQPHGTVMDLEGPNVVYVSSADAMDESLHHVPLDNANAESPGATVDHTVSEPTGSSKDLPLKPTQYEHFIERLQEAVREHIFKEMPIRVLHFTTHQDSDTKLQIALLDRNGIYQRIMAKIQTDYSETTFRERVEFYIGKGFRGNSLGLATPELMIIEELVREKTKYAILSHTWLRGADNEVTYGDWQRGQFDTQQPGYQKLAYFCKSAWNDHRLSFGWMDTVCINKDSSSELDESIRSMYKWYKSSDICIIYLAGTLTLGDINRDPWFTRGWTFQELLAPQYTTFYSKDWKKLVPDTSHRLIYNADILEQIYKATTIIKPELLFPHDMPISRKMQLAAKRKVMREEDAAYSLMGICGVSISIAYGEGAKRAFFRLMTEILNSSSKVVDIFNCAQKGGSSIIPSAPSAYLNCIDTADIMKMQHSPPIEPLLLTHVGLRMSILLMPSLRESDPCLKNAPTGDYYAACHLPAAAPYSWAIGFYHLLDKGIVKSITDTEFTFGILNFGGDTTHISVADCCLAVCFKSKRRMQVKWNSSSSSLSIKRIDTDQPIIFHLMNQRQFTSGEGRHLYVLKRNELVKHGMKLTTMYL